MEQIKIDRINFLARKSKDIGLNETEKEEQKILRQEYIEAVRNNLRSQLNSIRIKEKDGTLHKLRKRND